MRFTKLHATIVASSIWGESPQTCKVWITMLALADWDGVVSASVDGLAHLARVSIEECKAALATLSGPDEHSRDGTTGERIEKVSGGWLILNHNRYRDMRTSKQVKHANYMREYRTREAGEVHKSHSEDCDPHTSISISPSSLSGSGEEREHEREEAPKKPRKPKADPALFDRFWDAYQKKVAKGAALKAWNAKVGSDETLAEQVIAAAHAYADLPDTKKDSRKFQPHPASWLNAERWLDELPGVPSSRVVDPQMSEETREIMADIARRKKLTPEELEAEEEAWWAKQQEANRLEREGGGA